MNDLKSQIQQRLMANMLMEQCAQTEGIIFRDAWCSQDRIIRFTTPFFRTLFHPKNEVGGYWKTGDAVMYEVTLTPVSFSVRCAMCTESLRDEYSATVSVLSSLPSCQKETGSVSCLKIWTPKAPKALNDLPAAFDSFLTQELPAFEHMVADFLENTVPAQYAEGGIENFSGTKYERDPNARKACLAHHGTACAVCGMSFEKMYGPEFAGLIEVHHIVPLSQIRKEYIVDPIRDLIPLCPNCHAAIHRKKNCVYTVEQLKSLILSKKKEQLI